MNGSKCFLCPRKCGADRNEIYGFCNSSNTLKIARADFHHWEEPCICYGQGAGAIFFSGCNLKCVYCQNYEISSFGKGYSVSDDELEEIILKFSSSGASCIDLVNPTHYSFKIANILRRIKEHLTIPVVYNTSCYESVETLKMLEGLIDIYLPDFKYYSNELSERYSGAYDYFDVASKAIKEMYRQCGYAQYDGNNRMTKGVLTRHLVLPSHRRDSFEIIDYLANNYDSKRFALSLMSQYFPCNKALKYKEISRKLTTFEYQSVTEYAYKSGFINTYIQDLRSSDQSYVPQFFDEN